MDDIYKAVKNYLHNEMGLNRGNARTCVEELARESMDRAGLDADGVRGLIKQEIARLAKEGFPKSEWSRPRSFEDVVKECIRDVVREELKGFEITVSVNTGAKK